MQEWEFVGKSTAVGSQSRIESWVVNLIASKHQYASLSLQQPGVRAGPMMAQPPSKEKMVQPMSTYVSPPILHP